MNDELEGDFMKKFVSIILVFMIIFLSISPVVMAEEELIYFSQYEKVKFLVEEGIVIGRKVNVDDDPELDLDLPITRGEVSKLLVYSLGLSELSEYIEGNKKPFSDVPKEHWANGYISILSLDIPDLGQGSRLIYGFPDEKFYPEKDVTFEELATMLVRMISGDIVESYTDFSWPDSYIKAGDDLGLFTNMNLDDEDFSTDDLILRRDAFEMIFNGMYIMDSVVVEDILPEPEGPMEKPITPNNGSSSSKTSGGSSWTPGNSDSSSGLDISIEDLRDDFKDIAERLLDENLSEEEREKLEKIVKELSECELDKEKMEDIKDRLSEIVSELPDLPDKPIFPIDPEDPIIPWDDIEEKWNEIDWEKVEEEWNKIDWEEVGEKWKDKDWKDIGEGIEDMFPGINFPKP